MVSFPYPDNEEHRLAVLKAFEVLDSPAEKLFDQLIELALMYFQAPIGFISLIDSERQWFKAVRGLSAREISRENAFCSYTIINSDPLVVEDTTKDHRFMNNPWVTKNPQIRFYAGMPLTVRGDVRIGSLSIMDVRTRQLSVEQMKALSTFGEQAAELLESRLGRRQRQESERLIQRQERELQSAAKMAMLGGLAAGIAHEINNPLSVIMTRARQLVDRATKGPIEQEIVIKNAEAIEKTGTRIAKTVRTIKSFSRDEQQDPFTSAALKNIFEDSLELCADVSKASGAELRVRMPDEGVILECRSTEITQVLVNLFSNAFDAISEVDERWVAIDYAIKADFLEISVSDSGLEIPAAVRQRILEPFFTTKPPGKGTGLGLSISKKIVESHGGTLQLAPESATRFIVRLPLRHSL